MPPALLTAPDSLDKAPPNLAKPCMAIPTFDITVPIFCDDSEYIFSLDTKDIYLSCPGSELLHIGKRVYLMGTGVAYRLNRDDEYADMSSEDMAETCLELFGRLQRVWISGLGFPVLDLNDMEDSDEEEK